MAVKVPGIVIVAVVIIIIQGKLFDNLFSAIVLYLQMIFVSFSYHLLQQLWNIEYNQVELQQGRTHRIRQRRVEAGGGDANGGLYPVLECDARSGDDRLDDP